MRWTDAPAEEVPKLKTLVINGAFLSEKAVAVLPRFAPTLRRLDLSRVMLLPGSMKSIGELSGLILLLSRDVP